MSQLHEGLSQTWLRIQGSLFPWLREELGPLSKKQRQLITILEVVRVEKHLRSYAGMPGRPLKDRVAIARAFVAKMVYNMPFTCMLVERLKSDKALRRICGWEHQYQIPDESTFSRANAEFAASRLPERVHAALIHGTNLGDTIPIFCKFRVIVLCSVHGAIGEGSSSGSSTSCHTARREADADIF